jgi:predicted DNA-binding transcriptional regulator AlpA
VNRYLPSPRVAELLGLTDQSLRRWRQRGFGPPYHRLGDPRRGRVIYAETDVEEWLAARQFSNTSQEAVAAEAGR